MRIVFCNKYYFLNGGVERYLYNVMNYLSARGHTTVPFSVRYADSWPSPYEGYFLDPPVDPGQTHLEKIRLTPLGALRLLDRSLYSVEARIKLARLLKAIGGADIAYVLNIYNYMSPSILHTFRRQRIPVVMQIGDYNLLCANYSLLRDGKPCTLCVQGDYHHGLWHRCVKQRLGASAVRVAAMYLQRFLKIYRWVDAFVVPCEFMRNMLREGGFAEDRMHLLPYPVERRQDRRRKPGDRDGEGRREGERRSERIHVLQYPIERTDAAGETWEKKNYILYFGRISYEKGVDVLIQAFQKLDPAVDLCIIGKSFDGEEERLRHLIQPQAKDRIRFLGFRSGSELNRWIAEALFTVVPSRWYDNAPLSVYESFLYGTPVLASRIGGIPEQVEEGVTGELFQPDAVDELARKMGEMLADRGRLIRMGVQGQAFVKGKLLIKDQMDGLVNLFERVIDSYDRREV